MEILDSYLELLESQQNLFEQLFELAKQKQPILVNGELELLDILTKKEQKIIIQVGRLEEKRNSMHQALASHFNVSQEELTAKHFAELVTDEYKGKVQEITSQLQETVLELDKLNTNNTALLEQSLDFVNFSLNLLSGVDNSPTYGGKDEANKTLANIFDRKL